MPVETRYRVVLFTLAFAVLMTAMPALAQVDTAESSLSNAQDWLNTWIPLACVLVIIGAGLALLAGMLRMDWFIRGTMGMIIIGSASYIVSFFGIGT